MRSSRSTMAVVLLLGWCAVSVAAAAETSSAGARKESPVELKSESRRSNQSILLGGRSVAYVAEAGVQLVHTRDPLDDVPTTGDKPLVVPEATMSYTGYFLGKEPDPRRPIMFVFNGGPGSSTIWLHLGAFGPKRVVTTDGTHTPAAPYALVDNAQTLLPETDLVFIDAPGTGFSHLRGTDADKAFYGVDEDAAAFGQFIADFLSTHGRWNSPKFIFGESYGTTRAAALAYVLQERYSMDLNGVVLLSQILCFDNNADTPQLNPSVDQPYVLSLPTFAATAWYHHVLPVQAPALEPFLAEVEQFAMHEYLPALAAGRTLGADARAHIVERLHAYTGLPPAVIERANLRINVGVFAQHVLGDDRATGRLDTRFTGITLDPLAKEAAYDPQSAAISSAYVSAFNDYVRRELKFGEGLQYRHEGDFGDRWDYLHRPPGEKMKVPQATNVLPDLAVAMKQNPHLKVMMNGGYFDLATPYFAALDELNHLPVSAATAANIEVKLYPSGHMVYALDSARVALATNVADFIRRASAPVALH